MNNRNILIMLISVFTILFLVVSCEKEIVHPQTEKQTTSEQIETHNGAGIYRSDFNIEALSEPMIRKLLETPMWLQKIDAGTLEDKEYPIVELIEEGALDMDALLNDAGMSYFVEPMDGYQFKIDSLTYRSMLYLDRGTTEKVNLTKMSNQQMEWAIMYDPHYFGDLLEGDLFICRTDGSVDKKWANIENAPDFPVFSLVFNEIHNSQREAREQLRLQNRRKLATTDYLVVTGIYMQYDHEGSGRGNAEFEIYVGPDGTYQRYPGQTDHIFNGAYHVDAAGRYVYYPNVNDEDLWYIPPSPIALLPLTSTNKYIIPIESDTGPSGNHNNDKDASNPDRYIHDVSGYDMEDAARTWSVASRNFQIVSDPSGSLNDDPFHDSEIGNISSSLNSSQLPNYPNYKVVETELNTGIILRLARASY